MVDIHSHILPAVDDGARTWEIAEEMCRMAAADGITHTVATPHANDEYSYDRERHAATLAELQRRVGRSPVLSLGCDFHFSIENIQDAILHPARYTIGSSSYLLVEFSDFALSPFLAEALTRLQSVGLMLVVTHPERNLLLQRDPAHILRLIEQGCVIQVTASSFTGRFGESARRTARWLLERDAVHVLASDAHDLKNRPPVLSTGREAVEELRGAEIAEALVGENPRAILEGRPLPFYPEPTA